VPENALLRDCLFVMHGIDGQVLRASSSSPQLRSL
jgi:hypothetical protein